MKNILKLTTLIVLMSCKPEAPDVMGDVIGWEYVTTFQIYPAKSINIIEKRVKLVRGENHVLGVALEKKPILKPNAPEIKDLQSHRFLFLELCLKDSVVNPSNLGCSKIIREIIAMSPNYGANKLNLLEKIECRNISSTRWKVISRLDDFQFEGEFSFADSSIVSSKHVEMVTNP